MKKTTAFVLFLFPVLFGWAQKRDSIPETTQVLTLSISTPQPRLNETFQISIDVQPLQASIFKSLAGNVQLSNVIGGINNGQLTMQATAIKKGKNEIGPIVFSLDKTKYTTNKITCDVIDPLPVTDQGLWFRKVTTSDSTFSIIIEQRIRANTKTKKTADNTITFTTEPEFRDIVKFKDSYSINGVNGTSTHSSTNFSSVEVNGEDKEFMSGFSVYNFEIVDKKARITITKDKFDNIPAGYTFEDIFIQ